MPASVLAILICGVFGGLALASSSADSECDVLERVARLVALRDSRDGYLAFTLGRVNGVPAFVTAHPGFAPANGGFAVIGLVPAKWSGRRCIRATQALARKAKDMRSVGEPTRLLLLVHGGRPSPKVKAYCEQYGVDVHSLADAGQSPKELNSPAA